MNELKCKNCGKPLTQTQGKRAKEFCGVTCRSGYWQKKKRESGVIPAIKTKITIKKGVFVLDKAQHPEFFDSPKPDALDDELKMWSGAKPGEITHNPKGGYDMLMSVPFPEDFAGVLRLAKEWEGDPEVFKKRVDGMKLTSNQKSMIYSKLK